MVKKERCKKTVYPNEKWGSFHPHQCSFSVWKDGVCKKHHPDSVAEREKKQQEKYEQRKKTDPFWVNIELRKQIEELKLEIERLKTEIEKYKELERII